MAELPYVINLYNDTAGNWALAVFRNPTAMGNGSIPVLTINNLQNETQTEVNQTITGATNASPVVVTCTAHGYSNGDQVYISGVLGQTAANGLHIIAGVAANTFNLVDSITAGAYTSGGYVQRLAKSKNLADVLFASAAAILNDKSAGN